MPNTPTIDNIINHIVFVLDASASMGGVARDLIKVTDNQIAYLAQRSKEMDQETRVTVYTFNTSGRYVASPSSSNIQCLIYDKDVLRVPSIAAHYSTAGMTPLVDASILALDDLAMTPEKYGEHSFLVYVLTDGAENASRNRPTTLLNKINGLPEHWTVATFVPNSTGVRYAQQFGFPAANIAIWDATTAAGVAEAGEKIRQTTENFMQARKSGVRGSRNLFSLETPDLKTVKTSGLQAMHFGQYRLFDVPAKQRIDQFVERQTGRGYVLGEGYYQLSKREKVQAQKKVAILTNKGELYTGSQARQLLGLPDYEVTVNPADTPDYQIFIQSTSVNRNLMPNTKLLVLS